MYNKDMSKLVTLNGNNDQELLSSIFDNEIIVFEDVQGSKIWVNWDGKEFTIKPKSMHNEPINLIDLAMQNYYNPAINYFTSLDVRVKSLLNKKWWFCFEYFPDTQPANIEYSRVPKNGLVLTTINKNGKYEYSIEELDEYARLFDVDMLPIDVDYNFSDVPLHLATDFTNEDKVNMEWVRELDSADVFTIYDWKEPVTPTDDYNWHIGGNKRWVVAQVAALVA